MTPNRFTADRQSIQILLVEDDPDDVWVMRNLLGDRWDGPFKLTHVELLSAGLERIGEFTFDIILLDLSLPDSQGLETFYTMHERAADVPIVVLSGYNDESIAVRAVQAGRPGLPGQRPGGRQPARPLDSLRHRAHAAAQGRSGPSRRLGGISRGQGDPAASVPILRAAAPGL